MIRQTLIAVTVVFSVGTKADQCIGDQSPRYIGSSSLNIRSEPRSDAPVIDVLPIGTPIYVLSPKAPNEINCDPPLLTSPWLLICTHVEDPHSVCASDAHGWATKDMIEVEEPRLEALLAKHDATPKANVSERRKWAERAAALRPTDTRAQERLKAVLQNAGDNQALKFWQKKFANYLNPQPSLETGEKKAIFVLSDSQLTRFCTLDHNNICGQPFPDGEQQDAQQNRFMNRGKFYFVYSGGRHIGAVVTEQTNCVGGRCESTVPVGLLSNSKNEEIVRGLATNFVLPKVDPSLSISDTESAMLLALTDRWINSGKHIPDVDCPTPLAPREEDENATPEQLQQASQFEFQQNYQLEKCENHRVAKLALLKEIKHGKYLRSMIAARSSKGRMLVGLWGIGRYHESHYSNSAFIAFLLVAEPNKNGAYEITFADTDTGDCWISDHVDINSDGTDEILLNCDQLEGQTTMGLMTRERNQWKKRVLGYTNQRQVGIDR